MVLEGQCKYFKYVRFFQSIYRLDSVSVKTLVMLKYWTHIILAKIFKINTSPQSYSDSGILPYYDLHSELILPFWRKIWWENQSQSFELCGPSVPEVILLEEIPRRGVVRQVQTHALGCLSQR